MPISKKLKCAFLLAGCAILGNPLSGGIAAEPPSPIAKATSAAVEYQAPEKHHFNTDAPNRAWLILEAAPEKRTPLPLKIAARKASVALTAETKSKGRAQVRADLYLCDDAKTFCVKKTVIMPVPNGEGAHRAPGSMNSQSRGVDISGRPLNETTNNLEGWIHPPEGIPVRGVALMVHGLNLRPDKMDSIGKVLAIAGYLTWRTALTGHLGRPEDTREMIEVTRDRWLADIERAAGIVRTEAAARQVPVVMAGYSLGGLLAVDYLTRGGAEIVAPARMILFAPGLSIHPAFHALTALRFLGRSFVVPSRSLKDYRAILEGTPMGAYLASDESLEAVENALDSGKGARVAEVPTLVVMDPEDELIHLKGIRRKIEAHHLKAWSVLEVSNVATEVKGANHHFIINESALGREVWTEVASRIHAFLEGKPASGAITRAEICGKAGVWRTILRSECRDDSWTGCNRSEHACKPVKASGRNG